MRVLDVLTTTAGCLDGEMDLSSRLVLARRCTGMALLAPDQFRLRAHVTLPMTLCVVRSPCTMYDVGKSFTAGGSQDYTDSDAFNRAFLISIDKVGAAATVESLPPMKNPRGLGNVVVLPDGKLIITGGMTRSIVFSDINAVMPVEVFDPVTRTFKELASMSVPRNYHSVSLLLPDGTVFVGGGGMCPTAYGQSDAWCNRAADHMDGQIFSPPNLFNTDGTPATRPVIALWSSNIAANGYKVRAGGTLTVTMADYSAVSFVLVRSGSAMHSVNTDQRRIPVTRVVTSGARSTLTLPTGSGVLIPGPWYLFALNAKGVPSMAKTIQVVL